MSGWVSFSAYQPLRRSLLLYDGPSQLNGARIFAIASASNRNRKIGAMVQVWILPERPLAAIRTGRDAAVCGDCPLRGDGKGHQRTCYVWTPGVEQIYRHRGNADRVTPEQAALWTDGLQLRLGAYGDPVAVPLSVWRPLLETAAGWTAYTHAWRRADPEYQGWCMASVDSVEEQGEAVALGWRTFRTRAAGEPLAASEIACPHETHGVLCADCSLCRGGARQAKTIAVTVHGTGAKWFGSRRPAAVEELATV